MAVIIACRSCGRKLRVGEDQFGRKIRCPGCKDTFVADAGLPAEGISTTSSSRGPVNNASARLPTSTQPDLVQPDDEEEYEDDSRYGKKEPSLKDKQKLKRDGFKKVNLGLRLYIYYALVGLIGPITLSLLAILLGFIALKSGSFGMIGAVSLLTAFLFVVVFLAIWALFAAANILFVLAPNIPESGLKGLAIAVCAVGLGSIGFQFLGTLVNMIMSGIASVRYGFMPGFGGGGILSLLGILLAYSHIYVLVFFLRSVAFAMKRKDLASAYLQWLFWYIGVQVGSVLLLVLMCGIGMIVGSSTARSMSSGGNPFAMTDGFTVMLAVSCTTCILIGVSYLAMGIWHVMQVYQLRAVVDAWVRRRR